MMSIRRERGQSPRQLVQTIDGEKYWMQNEGSLTIENSSHLEEIIDGRVRVHLIAKTVKELEQRLKGFSRKYPGKIDVEKLLSEFEGKVDYWGSDFQINWPAGGHGVGRSLVKTAFAFASECGVPHEQCEKALEYLLDESTTTIPWGFPICQIQ